MVSLSHLWGVSSAFMLGVLVGQTQQPKPLHQFPRGRKDLRECSPNARRQYFAQGPPARTAITVPVQIGVVTGAREQAVGLLALA